MYVNGVHVWGTEPNGTKATESDYVFKRDGGSSTTVTNPTVTCGSVTTSGAKLSWNKVDGASKYGVFGYINGKWTKLTETTSTSYTFSGLKEGTSYKAAVLCYADGKWNEDYSKAVSFTTETEWASAPYPVISSIDYSEKYHQIRFTWNKVTGATNYGIAVYLAGKWRIQTQSIPASTLSYTTPKNLTPGKSYKVAIAAKVNGEWTVEKSIKNAVTVTVK
jgi:hypothetical protein